MAIDVHAHYVPPRVVEVLEKEGARYGISVVKHEPSCAKCLRFESGLQIRPFYERLLEPATKRIDWMRQVGLDRQILSAWADIFAYALPEEKGSAWHRLLNDSMAEFVGTHPEAFSWLASVPLPHAASAAKELERAVKSLGAVGAVLACNIEGQNLGEAPLDEFWSAATALGVPVFLHPTQPAPLPRTAKFNLNTAAQYTFDTTMCIGSLIGAGVLDRFPTLRLITSHGGGTFPYLFGRFDTMHKRSDPKAASNVAQQPPSAYLRRFWYDTILHHPAALKYLAERVQTDRLVIGTDESFPPHEADPVGFIRSVFDAGEVERIGERNPRELFKLPK